MANQEKREREPDVDPREEAIFRLQRRLPGASVEELEAIVEAIMDAAVDRVIVELTTRITQNGSPVLAALLREPLDLSEVDRAMKEL